MAASCNQVITITGGPGATSVQHIEYDATAHKLTLVKANGSRVDIHLADVQVHSAVLTGTDLVINMDDGFGGQAHAFTVDVSSLVNDPFANQAETDAGIISTKKLSPLLLATYIDHVLRDKPTGFAPLDANGFIPAKYMDTFAITDVKIAVDKAALDRLAATAGQVTKGDIGVATAESKSYIWDGSLWHELLTPTDLVLSVNGQTGVVVIPEPRGGIAFKPNETYVRGDSVSHGHHLFIRIAAGSEATWDATKWERSDSAGRIFSDLSTYDVGDIISYLGDAYINVTAIGTPGIWNSASWKVVSSSAPSLVPEQGGIAHDATINYVLGDMVVYNNIPYFANKVTTGAFVVADWTLISPAPSPERGGIIWNNAIQYKERDVVSMPGTDKLYIAMKDNIGSNPLGFIDWFELHSIRYDAGNFTPSIATEMPDTTTENEGALWYIDGLPDTGYTFTVGPFTGRTAQNNDKIIWYGLDSSGSDIWLLEPFPLLHGEVGGLSFSSTYDYPQGALTTDSGDTYIALGDVANGGGLPSVTPASWGLASSEPEIGGVAYDSTVNYIVDDIVAVGQIIFISNTASIGKIPGTDPEWTLLSLAEKGGLAYNVTQAYNSGDIVSSNGVIYAATAAVPIGTTPPNASFWATPSVSELGGRIWSNGLTYVIGDIVTDTIDGNVYSAIVTSIGSQPSATPLSWKRVGSDEIGGIAYDIATTYSEGDIVANMGGQLPVKVWISLADNNTGNPLLLGQYWQELDSIFHWVGLTDPTSGIEYPDTTGEVVGGIWRIDGLGIDANNDPAGYIFTTGKLTGVTAYDGDNLTWVDGVAGSEVWLLSKYPRISGEQGGVIYKSGRQYLTGDTVTYNNVVYSALKASTGAIPDVSPLDWQPINTHNDPLLADIDVSGWVSELSGIPGTTPANPAPPGSVSKLGDLLTRLDSFVDSGTI